MKTEVLQNSNIKVRFDNEAEFIIVNKNEPLIDTIIDGKIAEKKYAKKLVEEIRDAGFDSIHGVFIKIDDCYLAKLERMNQQELDEILNSFNSLFGTEFTYIVNENGLVCILFGRLDSYKDFLRNYFGTFLLKMVAFRINIELSEKNNDTLKGLSDFIARFVPEHFRTYKETTSKMKFINVIDDC